jgi:hypothetical protein
MWQGPRSCLSRRRTRSRRARALPLLVALATASMAWGDDVVVQPGRIVGDIQLKNAAALEPHLTGDPAAPGWESVRATSAGLQLAAQAGYEPAGSFAADGTFTAAHFDLVVDVGSWGSSFTLGVRPLQFASGAAYRFGPPFDWVAGGHACTGVQPVAVQPEGTRCDIAETASLVRVRVRFVGPDVGSLDGSSPVACRLTAWEQGVEQDSVAQATSAESLLSLTDLRGSGVVLPLLVRSGPSSLEVSCQAAVQGGSTCAQTCFTIDPGTGKTPLHAFADVDTPDGTVLDTSVDVDVRKNAGILKGKLEVVGHPIVEGEVILDDPDWGMRLALQPSPGYAPPLAWSFCGAPAGAHGVIASALLDEGMRAVVLPYKDGPNGQAFVPLCGTADLGSTFVTRPAVAHGLVRLRSPGGPLLSSLALGSVRWHSAGDFEGWSVQSSFAQAAGSEAMPVGGASGLGAFSRASLIGTIDAERRNADLAYSVLLPGLSPPNGPLDGTGALRTSWDVSRFGLRWGGWPDGEERLTLTSGLDLHYSGAEPGRDVTIPDQEICLSRVGLTLRTDSAGGRLRYPWLSFRSVGPFLAPASPAGTPLAEAAGNASGPWTGDEGRPEVSVPATLAAGFQYELRPSVYVALGPAGSSPSWTYVYVNSPIVWPSEGGLACGASAEICGSVGSGGEVSTGAVSILDATGTTSAPTEVVGSTAFFSARVEYSADMRPDEVSYVLDPSEPAVCHPGETLLCDGNCPDPARFDLTLTGLASGSHTLRVCAEDPLHCDPSHDHTFTVPPPPCPPGFTVVAAPGDTSVRASDARVASRLVATAPEGWEGTPTDDRPAAFPLGETAVHFTFAGLGQCATTVEVVPAQIGVTLRSPQSQQGLVELRDLSGPQDLDTVVTYFPDAGSDYAFSPDGRRLAVAGGGRAAVVRLPPSGNTAATTSLAVPPAALVDVGLPTGPWKIAWRPQSTDVYAVLGRAGTPPSWKVAIVRETQVVGGLALPPLPAELTDLDLTAIGFSPSGHAVTVAGTVRKPTGPGAGWYYVTSTWTLSAGGASASSTPVVRFRRTPGEERVHDILVREGGQLFMVTGKGLYQVQGATWTLLFARKNAHGVVLPGGQGALLAEEARDGVRLVHHLLAPPVTRVGPPVPFGKRTMGEVAANPDARFGALLAGSGDAVYVYIYRLDGLTAASAPVRASHMTHVSARHPAFRPY